MQCRLDLLDRFAGLCQCMLQYRRTLRHRYAFAQAKRAYGAEQTFDEYHRVQVAGRKIFAEAAFRAQKDPFLVKGNLADAHLRVDQAGALRPDLPGAAVLLAKILRYEEILRLTRIFVGRGVRTVSGGARASASASSAL